MDFPAIPATTTITVFTRHAPDCPKFADRYWRRCNCRKALYIYEGGADKIVSARTRSWEQAEKLAKAERDLRDPIRRKLQEIEDKEAQRAALRKSKNITVSDATDRWLRSQRWKSKETETIYRCAASRINTWAADTGVNSLPDITADMLHEGRGFWSSSAKKKYNRIGLTSQSAFLGYLKRFFRYAVRIELLARNPAQELTPISKSKRRTQVLTSWWRSALSQDRERFLPDYFL
jgi:hypothetical protein